MPIRAVLLPSVLLLLSGCAAESSDDDSEASPPSVAVDTRLPEPETDRVAPQWTSLWARRICYTTSIDVAATQGGFVPIPYPC